MGGVSIVSTDVHESEPWESKRTRMDSMDRLSELGAGFEAAGVPLAALFFAFAMVVAVLYRFWSVRGRADCYSVFKAVTPCNMHRRMRAVGRYVSQTRTCVVVSVTCNDV